MKKIFLIAGSVTLIQVNAQLYAPNGSTGITVNPATGNVGIGTNNPQSPLTVNGHIFSVGFGSLNFGDNAKFPVSSSDVPTLSSNLSPLSTVQYGLSLAGTSSSAELWVSGNAGIRMFTAGNPKPKLNILSNGNIGIGAIDPQAKLDITTDDHKTLINYNNTPSITFFPKNGDSWFHMSHGLSNDFAISQGSYVDHERLFTIKNNGNIGIGTKEPDKKLEIYNTAANGHLRLSANDIANADMSRIDIDFHIANRNQTIARIASRYENSNDGGYGGLRFLTSNAGQMKERLTISPSGKVGIGQIYPQNELDVNGVVHAKEVKVDLNGWADYVFKSDYPLPSLEEVEKHILKAGHLPNVPSEKEVLQNGVNLGDNQRLLLQKIEELTLYTIEQNKQLKAQNEQLKHQAEKIEKLEQALTTQKTK